MNYRIIYEDETGYCRIIFPHERFKQNWETEQSALARLYQAALPGICEFIACDPDKIPQDTTFRDAWEKGNAKEPIRINFEKAIQIHRQRLEEAANLKIEQLNKELELAIEKDNLPQQVAINRTKNILRTIHEMNLTHCKNVEDIKQSVPAELRDVWKAYPL